MRGREFLMKDAYSFDIDEAAARRSYNRMFVAYLRTFARMGLKGDSRCAPRPARSAAISATSSSCSRRPASPACSLRQATCSICRCLADDVDYNADLTPIIQQWTTVYAATEDVHDAARFDSEDAGRQARLHTRGIEVGQIFYFGD